MKKSKISKALLEVWQWKEKCYSEVKNLPIEKAIEKRIEDLYKTVKRMGFKLSPVPVRLKLIKNK